MVKQKILTETLPPIRVPNGTIKKIKRKCNGKMQISEYIRNIILKDLEGDIK